MLGPSRIKAPLLALAAAGALVVPPAAAQSVADFYKGKNMRLVVGYDPGGGYDFYSRIFAQYFSKFMPGNPVVVVQNMPGAGSVVAAKFLYSAAPQDGTMLGCLAETLVLDHLIAGDTKDFDPGKLSYVGRMAGSVNLGIGAPGANFKSEDATKRELLGGSSGTASTSWFLPMALNKHGGTKFKMVTGYKGSNDMMLASERKEIDFVGSYSFAVVLSQNPDWILEKKAPIIYQGGLTRHPLLPDVPSLPEFGKTEEDKAVLTAIASSSEVGRAINTTPNVPADRLAALRAAFDAMTSNKEFLADMKEKKVIIEPLNGAEVDKIQQAMLKLPPNVIALTKAVVAPPK